MIGAPFAVGFCVGFIVAYVSREWLKATRLQALILGNLAAFYAIFALGWLP